ncbi:hypothetical protein DSECCO2_648970 [anaerobic digester metagenome]
MPEFFCADSSQNFAIVRILHPFGESLIDEMFGQLSPLESEKDQHGLPAHLFLFHCACSLSQVYPPCLVLEIALLDRTGFSL